MGFLGLFKLKLFHPEEFEQQLTALTQAISLNREQIAALKRKQRVWRRHLILYCLVLYLSYVAVRYKNSCSNLGVYGQRKSRLAAFVAGQLLRELAAVCLLPVLIAFVVYVINALFRVLLRSKNHSLNSLLKKHRAKLEELKQVTNFSRTNQILEKFDAKQAQQPAGQNMAGKSLKAMPQPQPQPQPQLQPKIPQNIHNKQGPQSGQKQKVPATINIPNVQPQAKSVTPKPRAKLEQAPAEPAKLTFQDRLLDFIIGSDHNENVENRYALICANCYVHNGLAPPGCKNPVCVTYICRHCGFINGDQLAVHMKMGQSQQGSKQQGSRQQGPDEHASEPGGSSASAPEKMADSPKAQEPQVGVEATNGQDLENRADATSEVSASST